METENKQLEKPADKILTTKDLFSRDDVRNRFTEMLGKKAQGFITSVLQIVQSNANLKNADPLSVYNAAAVAATLDLPLNNNLGFAYIVPYNQKYQDGEGQWKSKQVAQFQMGYKGFIQLAQRSGQFKTISAAPIYKGQLISENPLTGYIFDFTKKESEEIIGYASYFSLINGFEKTLYMPAATMEAHGKRFSKSFENKTGLWKTDPLNMGLKTVTKLLLSRYAPLSIEMQTAVKTDQGIIKSSEAGTEDVEYVDSSEETQVQQIDKVQERISDLLKDCKTLSAVQELALINPELDSKLIDARIEEIEAEEKKAKGGKKDGK